MRRLRWPVILLAAATLASGGTGTGTASAAKRAHRIDPAVRDARAMVRDAPPAVSRRLGTLKSPAVRALAGLLRDGVVPRDELSRLLSNEGAAEVIPQALVDLERVQHIPGAIASLRHLARQKQPGGARGPAFELRVTAVLGPNLDEVGAMIAGHETDGLLADGTVVESKAGANAYLQHSAISQVKQTAVRRGVPGLIVGDHRMTELTWTTPERKRRYPRHQRWAETAPWDLRDQLARRTGDEVAVGYIKGDRLIVQIPSRHLRTASDLAPSPAR